MWMTSSRWEERICLSSSDCASNRSCWSYLRLWNRLWPISLEDPRVMITLENSRCNWFLYDKFIYVFFVLLENLTIWEPSVEIVKFTCFKLLIWLKQNLIRFICRWHDTWVSDCEPKRCYNHTSFPLSYFHGDDFVWNWAMHVFKLCFRSIRLNPTLWDCKFLSQSLISWSLLGFLCWRTFFHSNAVHLSEEIVCM